MYVDAFVRLSKCFSYFYDGTLYYVDDWSEAYKHLSAKLHAIKASNIWAIQGCVLWEEPRRMLIGLAPRAGALVHSAPALLTPFYPPQPRAPSVCSGLRAPYYHTRAPTALTSYASVARHSPRGPQGCQRGRHPVVHLVCEQCWRPYLSIVLENIS
jgi:hypothetical protein